MQYILTKEEYESLQFKSLSLSKLPSLERLQKFCTYVSDNLILQEGWNKGNTWGCILTVDEEWYCDDCPSQGICPYEYKSWSK